MAKELDIGVSTFWQYLRQGLLPAGVKRGGLVRWHVQRTCDAWEGKAVAEKVNAPELTNLTQPGFDPILEASRGKATQKRR
ncbi:hypothetical protein FS320_31635 [Microvirga tunisiensis]|uniref:Helix-turn-helix domain-containing protein n=1 Tax=Microvirga tunisiensis TaxID=2108360 RepID=A0A5N7MS87_9HYPH|nr:hypothetical protein [Microvirga tunisiensis]MPR29520.1 hypothetical protein [Microvirga tunisiensis]